MNTLIRVAAVASIVVFAVGCRYTGCTIVDGEGNSLELMQESITAEQGKSTELARGLGEGAMVTP